MKPVEDTYPGLEREWDSVTIIRTDFRRHWNGDGVSLTSIIRPGRTAAETAELAQDCARQIANWVLSTRESFGPEDRFEIVLGWPLSVRKTRRKIVRTGGTIKDIEDISSQKRAVPLLAGWDTGIFT